MRRYVIVGTGVAGIAAAEAIREADPQARILLIGDEPEGYYSRPGLAYYLTDEVPEKQLFPWRARDFRRLGINLWHDRVVALDPRGHRLKLQRHSEPVPYDRLLLATGSVAVRPDLPGVDLQGVVKLDTLADARRIRQLARKAKAAVVIGGGITALEIVEGLLHHKVQVHYLLRGDRYWRRVLDEQESRIVERRLSERGVRLHYRTQAAEIMGRRGRVTGVRTTDGRVIPAQMVAIAVGVRPRLALPRAAGLRTERGVLADEYLRTSDEDIFAAGDVAQVYDPRVGASVLDDLWSVARAQGRAAGYNMAGWKTPCRRGTPLNVTRLAGLTTTIVGQVGQPARDGEDDLVGIIRGDSEVWRSIPDAIVAQEGFSVNRLRLMVGKKHLLGAVLMGDQTLSRPLYHLIDAQADITPIRERLIQGREPVAEVLAEFWIQWSRQHGTQKPQS
ncbi:MAG: NAD(P)/FAD-dependent oxidoreductase [Chloroflexi bacterium]|nr:NAD(P)/FAD-dependent oxidoreductase [Chloroflexota bacterium]